MQLSKTDECMLLKYHLERGSVEEYIKNELEIHRVKFPIEEAMNRIEASVFSNTTNTEWENYNKSRQVLISLFHRRKYDVWKFFATEETMKERYPDGAPELVNIDHDLLPPRTLQLGLYLFYMTTEIQKPNSEQWKKMDDDEKEGYERMKDWHDWLNGYLNQEAIQSPLITIKEIHNELENKKEILMNHIQLFFDNLNT